LGFVANASLNSKRFLVRARDPLILAAL